MQLLRGRGIGPLRGPVVGRELEGEPRAAAGVELHPVVVAMPTGQPVTAL